MVFIRLQGFDWPTMFIRQEFDWPMVFIHLQRFDWPTALISLQRFDGQRYLFVFKEFRFFTYINDQTEYLTPTRKTPYCKWVCNYVKNRVM